LVGLRSDFSDASICDILFVYDDNDIHYLSLVSSSISNILYFHNNHDFSNKHSDLFSQEISVIGHVDNVVTNDDVVIDFNIL